MKKLYMAALLCVLIASTSFSLNAQNSLSGKEKKNGWILLFDGETTSGWRTFNSGKAGSAWKVSNGELYLDKTANEGRGDLLTDKEYQDYELSMEWKIDACGNSGIIFHVVEDAKYAATYLTGPEMQVLDNACHPDAKIIKHRAGDLYDMISCSKETVKPAGEWNLAQIISHNGKMEFWLNGTKVVEFTMHTPQWNEMVANSKFKTMPDFGKALKGRIALQDHGDQVWFRNIKIKVLK
jgi:Domain of Unknown Function (DUF1080)